MKKIITLFILFNSSFGFSQEEEPKTYAYDSESYMAHRHLEWGDFDEAIKTQKNAIELCKLDFKDEELKYCELNGKYELLLMYAEIEDYNTAFDIAFEIINKIETSVHIELEIKVKEELAELNFINGNYDKTIQIYNNLIELDYKNKFRYLKKLGETYFLIEDFENALLIYEKLLREITNGYKEYNIRSVVYLKKILLLQKAIGNEQGYLEMVFVSNKVIGELIEKEKNEFSLLQNKKGVFQNTINRKIYQIISLHIDKLEISLGTKSQTSLDYAISIEKFIDSLEHKSRKDIITFYPNYYKVLSDVYYFNEKYEKSLTTFSKILQEEKESIKKYNISRVYYTKLKQAFKLYYTLNKYNQLVEQLVDYNIFTNNQISSNLMFKTEKNKSDFVVNILDDDLNQFSNFNYATKNKFDKGIIHSMNNILTSKGLLLNAIKNILSQLESLHNESINDKILQFRSKRTYVNRQLQMPISERVNNFTEQKESLELLEREIVILYTTNFNKKINYIKDWKKTQLKENDLAIEFTHFKVFNKKRTDSTMYAAYLYKKDWKTPIVVNLFEEKQLQKYFSISGNPNDLYKTRGTITKSNSAKLALADSIYKLVWKPLEKYVDSSSTIYFSPDGLLHKIPFAALPNKDNKLIGEVYNIQQMGNTADVGTNAKQPNLNDILLIGGVKYEYKIDVTKQKNEFTYSVLESEELLGDTINRSISRNGFTYLKGTAKEIKDITTLLGSSKQLSGYNATETAFKELSGNSPSVLHIATHGFFFKKPKEKTKNTQLLGQQNTYKQHENPLLRSGLLFANANYAWQNGNNPYEKDDGILTALEISNLDLKNTDIVILSACETGLGDIEGSEGVYGLQRAFKMAGVKIIIMSLWPVPDEETAEFMNLFYKNWKQFNNPKKAFKTTQKTMMQKYRKQPEKWAAFVYFE